MGGRFGKYGDLKRREALQRGRREKAGLERGRLAAWRSRENLLSPMQRHSTPSAGKTFKTAVVVIPPENLWGPIQGLRRRCDRHFRRWMPHITLLYPFRPSSAFAQLTPLLARACGAVKPFEVRLARFDVFDHSRRNASLFLIPEPADAFRALHRALLETVPDCDDSARFSSGYTPHLSVGQARSRQAQALCAGWQAGWQPLVFTVTQVHLIWRNNPPDDLFRVGPVLPLGRP